MATCRWSRRETFAECLRRRSAPGWRCWRSSPPSRRLWPGAGDAGRILDRIVEFKDANESERAITLCNAGCYAADAQKFFRWAAALKNDNAQKEYYLTDVPALRASTTACECAVAVPTKSQVMGVNSRAELAEAEAEMQERLRARRWRRASP